MNALRRDMLYEVRYLIAAPALLWMYWQYVVVYQGINAVPWLRNITAIIWVPLGLSFALQNIAFNATFGVFLFWERPRQWFFSDRIRAATAERQARYKRLLNAHDPEHI